MAIVVDGQGTTVTLAGVAIEPKSLTVPGWAKEVLSRTTLANTAVKTKQVAKLKEISDFVLTKEYNPGGDVAGVSEANGEVIITFPDSAGSLTFWGTATQWSEPEVGVDGELEHSLTITPTNLNAASAETPPVWAGS